jgi:hypothetical protein
MMTLVDTKLSVREARSGHFEAGIQWSEAASLADRREAADCARDFGTWRIGGANSTTVRGERQSGFRMAEGVSRRTIGEYQCKASSRKSCQ